jgi:hypothetical protein
MGEPSGFDHDIQKMLNDDNISLMAITLQECRKQLGEAITGRPRRSDSVRSGEPPK